jgi:hypothetical protein
VHRLKVVGTEHHDHQRKRRVDLDALREPDQSIAARLERIVPHGAPAIEAILDHAHGATVRVELVLQNARPACVELEAPAGIGDDSPGQRIGVDQDLLHN